MEENQSKGQLEIDWLKGLRIVLVANYVPGAMAAYLLRALGAEIIKVEPPQGDMLRAFPPFLQGQNGQMGAWFRGLNGGFRSICLDLKNEIGCTVFTDLLQQADVLIDGNRPGFIAGLLGAPPTERYERLIYTPISAYGQKGPMMHHAGHDNNLLALAGNLSYTPLDREGKPAVFSAPIADIFAGQMAAFTALAAIMGRDRGSTSDQDIRSIDTSMLHSAFFLNQMQVAAMNVVPAAPQPDQAWMNGALANYATYLTADQKPIFFGPIEEKLFGNFCSRLDREDLMDFLYMDNARLKQELTTLFASKRLSEWEDLLINTDCCFTRIQDLREAMDGWQVRALDLAPDVEDPHYGRLRLAGYPAGFGPESLPPSMPETAPEMGADTEYVLSEVLGYDDARIDLVWREGAFGGR